MFIVLQLIQQLSPEDPSDTPTTPHLTDNSDGESTEAHGEAILDLLADRSKTSLQITKESSADSIQAISEDSSEVDYSEINDSLPNTVKTISIDLRKMAHHSLDYNNPTFFLTSLNPKTVVLTSLLSWFNTRERSCLPNSSVFAAASDSAAVVSSFTSSGIQSLNNTLYLFSEQGAVYSDG